MSSWRHNLKQWNALSARERRIFCVACLLLPAISLSIKWNGLKTTTRWLSRGRAHAVPAPVAVQAEVARSVARLVTAAAVRHPFRTVCLAQSVTLWFLLSREGVDSAVRIGVNKADGAFSAHAWIEVDGQVFLDGPDVVNHFTVIV